MHCGHSTRVRTLYKAILKLHRGLPGELRIIGDNYVKDEFRRNKKNNDAETIIFMNEWTNYAISLANQLGIKGPATAQPLGEVIDTKLIDQMSDEQLGQMYDLMLAAKGIPSDDTKE